MSLIAAVKIRNVWCGAVSMMDVGDSQDSLLFREAFTVTNYCESLDIVPTGLRGQRYGP